MSSFSVPIGNNLVSMDTDLYRDTVLADSVRYGNAAKAIDQGPIAHL
jgi:hypothetical protein